MSQSFYLCLNCAHFGHYEEGTLPECPCKSRYSHSLHLTQAEESIWRLGGASALRAVMEDSGACEEIINALRRATMHEIVEQTPLMQWIHVVV